MWETPEDQRNTTRNEGKPKLPLRSSLVKLHANISRCGTIRTRMSSADPTSSRRCLPHVVSIYVMKNQGNHKHQFLLVFPRSEAKPFDKQVKTKTTTLISLILCSHKTKINGQTIAEHDCETAQVVSTCMILIVASPCGV